MLGSEYPTEGFTTFEAAAEAGKAAVMKAAPQPQAPSATSESAKPVISSPDKPSIALLAERLHNACYSLGVADERYTSDYQLKKASDKAEAVKAELLAAVAAAIAAGKEGV